MKYLILLVTMLLLPLLSQEEVNPPMNGFNLTESSPEAIKLADKVMEAAGGRENWDNTRHITWRFFGGRLHVWDKWTGQLRYEQENLTVLMNLESMDGSAWKNGQEITNKDSLEFYLDQGYKAWINDSYWMFLPFKLKDSGVTLKHIGSGKTADGAAAEIVELTFKEIGVTPNNKYHVYIDVKSHLITQWDFFTQFSDSEPRFSTPWGNWKRHGKIMLSDKRGENRGHSEIMVFDHLPKEVYHSPAPVNLGEIKKEQKKNGSPSMMSY